MRIQCNSISPYSVFKKRKKYIEREVKPRAYICLLFDIVTIIKRLYKPTTL